MKRMLDPVDTVTGVQARCKLLGYDCGPIDGELGDATSAALKAFQTLNGLAIDGQVGAETQSKLLELYGC